MLMKGECQWEWRKKKEREEKELETESLIFFFIIAIRILTHEICILPRWEADQEQQNIYTYPDYMHKDSPLHGICWFCLVFFLFFKQWILISSGHFTVSFFLSVCCSYCFGLRFFSISFWVLMLLCLYSTHTLVVFTQFKKKNEN